LCVSTPPPVGGSSVSLVVQAPSDRKATPAEREQIRKLLDTLDRKSR